MAPPRRRTRPHLHKESWEFDWRNPAMKVLRRPFYRNLDGSLSQREEVVDARESSLIATESLEDSQNPEWTADPSYQWGKKARLARKRRIKDRKRGVET